MEETGHLLKPANEQIMDIQILSPLTMSPPESRPSSSQENYPDLASQMESFYQEPDQNDNKCNSKVLSWINEGKDMLYEDTGIHTEQRSTSKYNHDSSIYAKSYVHNKLTSKI